MKYLLYGFLTCMTLLSGCTKKTEDIFDQPVDVRLNAALAAYQTALSSGPGWKLFVYPKGLEQSQNIKVGGLTYYLKFSTNNRVTMVSDFDTAISYKPAESGYRLKALQRPSLIFDTYSYMHIPADPDPNVSFSPTGSGGYGLGTDFNFSFKEVTPKDTMYLEGNFNKSAAVLVRATQAEMDAAFVNRQLFNIMKFTYAYPLANPFLYIKATPSLNVGVGFDFNNVFITFSYVEAGALISKSEAFSFTTYGMHLEKAVTIGNYTFQDIYYDDVLKVFYITSGSNRVDISASTVPIVSVPLTTIIGAQYKTISVPPGAGLPNESPLFLTRYNLAKNGMLAGPYRLIMDDMDFVFNAATKTMLVNVYAFQGTVGPFLLQYNYSYTVDGSGAFKFTKTTQNGNASLVVANMNNILSLIESDQFTINGLSTSQSFLGLMTSKQTPTFYFTGYLY